ncbi:MAG: hypothetical protein ABWJ42_05290 [Sulfolobales archaeon]
MDLDLIVLSLVLGLLALAYAIGVMYIKIYLYRRSIIRKKSTES